jgi:hypothetical protein
MGSISTARIPMHVRNIRIQTNPNAMDEEDGELRGGMVGGTGKVYSSPYPRKGAR